MQETHNSEQTKINDRATLLSHLAGELHALISFCLETGIQLWVRFTGKLVRRAEAPWLGGPLGGEERGGTNNYQRVAPHERLLNRTPPDAGRPPQPKVLRGPSLQPHRVHPHNPPLYRASAPSSPR